MSEAKQKRLAALREQEAQIRREANKLEREILFDGDEIKEGVTVAWGSGGRQFYGIVERVGLSMFGTPYITVRTINKSGRRGLTRSFARSWATLVKDTCPDCEGVPLQSIWSHRTADYGTLRYGECLCCKNKFVDQGTGEGWELSA